MPRLPIPGSDEGVWGDILNEFLTVELNSDGSLKRANEIAGKLSRSGDTMSGNLDLGNHRIIGLSGPVNAQDAVTKAYVDGLALGGGVTPKNSIEIDSDELQLVGDSTAPGTTQYYGTDGSGARGYHSLTHDNSLHSEDYLTQADVGNFVEDDDPRLSDERTPSDDSVTNAKVATTAEIDPSKIAGTAVVDSDARLSDARTPLSHASTHENGGSDELDVTGLSGELADPQTPKTHSLAGSEHSSATLVELNAKVSDATLDDVSNPRTPLEHGNEAHSSEYVDAAGAAAAAPVQSVNSQTGAVTLDASDVGALADTATLDDLSDVTVATPNDGDALRFDTGTGSWIPGTISADDRVAKAGDVMSGTLDMNGNAIVAIASPANPQDATPKSYVDNLITNETSAIRFVPNFPHRAAADNVNRTWITIPPDTAYTVPSGKTLYVMSVIANTTSYDPYVLVGGSGSINRTTGPIPKGDGALRLPLIAGSGMVVAWSHSQATQTVSQLQGFLVDADSAITPRLMPASGSPADPWSYTVPAGKEFWLMHAYCSTNARIYWTPTTGNGALEIVGSSGNFHNHIPLRLGPGDILAKTTGTYFANAIGVEIDL